MATKFCTGCGNALNENSQFCTNCGKPSIPAAPAQPQAQPQPQPQPRYAAPNQGYAPPNPGYAPPNQGYAPQPQYYQPPRLDAPLSVVQYIGMFLLAALPVAGFILLLMWAFGDGTNINKKNYARAILIISLIGIGLAIIFSIFFAAIFIQLFNNLKFDRTYY